MWSQKELDSIFARTGLAPPSAFLQAAVAMRLDVPSLFEGGDAADQCDALSFHNVCWENLGGLAMMYIAFLPFWQVNNQLAAGFNACRPRFFGCVCVLGILVND